MESTMVFRVSHAWATQSFADGVTNDEVLLAYYSSHEYPQPKGVGNNPANIHLAHLRVRHVEP